MKIRRLFARIIFIPLIALVATYATYAIEGFLGSREFAGIIHVLRFDQTTTLLLSHGVFLLDGTVASLLLFGGLLLRRFPFRFLYAWAICWPWVPIALEWYGHLPLEIGESAAVSVLALLAFVAHHYGNATFFARYTRR